MSMAALVEGVMAGGFGRDGVVALLAIVATGSVLYSIALAVKTWWTERKERRG